MFSSIRVLPPQQSGRSVQPMSTFLATSNPLKCFWSKSLKSDHKNDGLSLFPKRASMASKSIFFWFLAETAIKQNKNQFREPSKRVLLIPVTIEKALNISVMSALIKLFGSNFDSELKINFSEIRISTLQSIQLKMH